MSTISESPLSNSRIVVIALMAAVPPPTMTWRLGIGPRTLPCQLGRCALGGEVALPVLREVLDPHDGVRRARRGALRVAAAEVALERLVGLRVVEDRAVRAGQRAQLA